MDRKTQDTDKRWVKQHIGDLKLQIKMLDFCTCCFIGLGLTSGKLLVFVFTMIFCCPLMKKSYELGIELKRFQDFIAKYQTLNAIYTY